RVGAVRSFGVFARRLGGAPDHAALRHPCARRHGGLGHAPGLPASRPPRADVTARRDRRAGRAAAARAELAALAPLRGLAASRTPPSPGGHAAFASPRIVRVSANRPRLNGPERVLELIAALELKPHPEQGFFVETYRASQEVAGAHGPLPHG